MSYGYRERVRRTTFIWERMTEADKKDILGWCPLSDQLIKRQYGSNANVDAIIEKMSDAEFATFHNLVMDLYHKKLQKKKATIRYLREHNRNEQADQLQEELDQQISQEEINRE